MTRPLCINAAVLASVAAAVTSVYLLYETAKLFHSRDKTIRSVQTPCTPEAYCASKLERDKQRQTFIEAIRKRKKGVLKLASSHNMQRRCTEFRECEFGSFNVCFFVEFPSDGKQWVVRFPICPVQHEPWQKLQSEIATMECVILYRFKALALNIYADIFRTERRYASRVFMVMAQEVYMTQIIIPACHTLFLSTFLVSRLILDDSWRHPLTSRKDSIPS